MVWSKSFSKLKASAASITTQFTRSNRSIKIASENKLIHLSKHLIQKPKLDMKSLVPFTTAILALVFYDASESAASCSIGYKGSIFLPNQHQTLIGHSIFSQSGIIRIQCMMLCWRHIHCMSFNHNDISAICQLNDASKEEFPESYKQGDGFSYFGGSSNKAKLPPEDGVSFFFILDGHQNLLNNLQFDVIIADYFKVTWK